MVTLPRQREPIPGYAYLCPLAWRQPLQQHNLLKCPKGMADENEKRKINRIQLFGFMHEKRRKINVFREKPVFPESKRRLTFIFLGREKLL